MKTLTVSLSMFAILLFASCKGGSSQNTNSKNAADSVAVDITEPTASLPQPGKGALAAFDLTGNVSKLITEDLIIYFDENGKITKADGIHSMEYDKDGRLVSYTIGEYDCASTYKLKYDKNGFLAEYDYIDAEAQETTTLTRNENGLVAEEHTVGEYAEMGAEESTKEDYITKYEYTSFDKTGNWTVKTIINGSEKKKQTRAISYFVNKEEK